MLSTIYFKTFVMKKIIWLLIITGSIWSCNTNSSDSKAVAPAAHEEGHEHGDSAATELALNNGVKWKADSSTQNNVQQLQVTLESFNSSSERTLEAYHALAVDLQRGLSKMVNECKMKGADHDALHLWLEPLMGQVKDLKKSSAIAGAAQFKETIQRQVNLYQQYFEL